MENQKLNKIERVVLTALSALTTPAWIIFIIVSAGQVVARYVLDVPFLWAEELARFTLIWFSFLGAIQLVILDDHIDIDYLVRRSGFRLQRALWLLRHAAIIATGAMLVWGTKGLIGMSRALSPATGIPVSWWYAAGMAAGAGFFLISSIRVLAWVVSKTRSA